MAGEESDVEDNDQRGEQLIQSLKYHRPNKAGEQRLEEIRRAFIELVRELVELTTKGREQTISFRRLEEAAMWAIKSVVLEDGGRTGPPSIHG